MVDRLTIGLLSWVNSNARLHYFERCLFGLRRVFTDVPVNRPIPIIVSSERLSTDYAPAVAAVCREKGAQLHVRTGANDLGANWNRLLSLCANAPYVFLLQDDFEPIWQVRLTPLLAFLERQPEFGAVRLGPLPFTSRLSTLDAFEDGVELDPKGDWLYDDGPRLVSRRLLDAVGDYPENCDPAAPELAMQAAVRRSGFRIAAVDPPVFTNIGGVSTWR